MEFLGVPVLTGKTGDTIFRLDWTGISEAATSPEDSRAREKDARKPQRFEICQNKEKEKSLSWIRSSQAHIFPLVLF